VYGLWFFISSRFATILNELEKARVQFLPLNINGVGDSTLPGYKVANVINVVDAINYEKSTYSIFELDDEKFMILLNMC